MDPVWYYVRGGLQTGPVSFEELKSAAAAGQLAAADLVWQEGTPEWVPARTVPGLFAEPPPPPLPAGEIAEALPEALPPDDAPVSPRRKRPDPLPGNDSGGSAGKGKAGEILALAMVFLRRATEPNPATIAPDAAEEDRLTQAGIIDPTARKYAVWRRAMLWVAAVPTAFAGLFGFINAVSADMEPLSGFGVLMVILEALVFFALPTSAVLAALAYDRPRDSARWVLLGAGVSIGFPVLMAFIPGHWLLTGSMDSQTQMTVRFVFSIYLYMLLLPLVLSLLPAVSRACVRVKSFLPQSLVPGWGLVATAPLFALLTLATFVLLYQVVGNLLLLVGLVLWVGAPLFYLTKFRLLTQPVTQRRDTDALARTQVGVLALITAGVVFIILFLFTAKVGGMPLMGTDDRAWLRPWSLDIHKKWIEFVGRSLFMTVLFADLVTRMALSVWREEKAFSGSEGAAAFDRTMTGLTESLGQKRGE